MSELSYAEMGEILALIENLDCDFLELDYGGLHLRIGRGGQHVPDPPVRGQPEPVAQPQPVSSGSDSAAVAANPVPRTDDGAVAPEGASPVEAPMMGTFYRAPSPDKPPYVQQGDAVHIGQTVGLIEVMKLFTELRAEVAGTVVQLAAADGALVEFGEPLLWIGPA